MKKRICSFVLIIAMLAMFLVSFDITVFADSSSEPAAGTAAESDRPTSTAVSGGNVSSTNKGSAVFANSSASEHYYDWKQNDPRWSSITIGSKTMGENGSAVTSLAMLLVKSGFKNESDFNPGTFANDLKSVGAFNGDEFDWNAPTKIVPQFKYCGETTAQYNGGYGWESLAEYYDEGYYMLVSPNNVHWMAVSSASTRYIGSTARFSDADVYDPSGNVSWLDGERFYTLRVKLFSAPNVTGIVQSGSYSSEGDEDEMEFVLYESGLLEISGNGNMCGYIYRDTPPWQKNKNLISSVRISGNITNIGGGAFDGCSNLTSITIPNSVTSIGSEAFCACSSLTSVTIPDSVTSIGNCVFWGCSSLNNIDVMQENKYYSSVDGLLYNYAKNQLITCPGGKKGSLVILNSVTSIGSYAFYGCSGLSSITIPNSVTSIGNSAFYSCSGLSSITISNSVTSIGSNAFYNCSGLTSITIPNSVTSIEYSSFEYCSGLKSITIPDSVTSIGSNAFYNCSGLTSITIPNSVTSIGDDAFSGCSGLSSITISNSVTSIGNSAFIYCSKLMSITIPNSVTSIGSGAFYSCNKLTNVYYQGSSEDWQKISIGSSNTPLASANFHYQVKSGKCGDNITYTLYDDGLLELNGSGAMDDYSYDSSPWYANKDSIKNVAFKGAITSIGACAFSRCSGLTSITIPNSVTSIGDDAFSGCSGLTSITIPNSVTSIGKYAFSGCSSLTSVTIPDSVTSIGNSAFIYCSKLMSITIPNSVTSIEYSSFEYCSGLKSITIPKSVKSIGGYAFSGCSGLTSITIPNSVTSIGSGAFSDCRGLTSITIPDSVTSIGSWAFSYCSRLTSISIPNSVTSIGNDAFFYCSSLTSVTIPNSVTSISSHAFNHCSSLTSINIPNSVTLIGVSAFDDCSSLTSVTIPNSVTSIGSYAFSGCSSLTSVTIPNSVISISNDVFRSCSGLTSIIIPNSVTSIGSSAFSGCDSLKDIYYSGTESQWNNLNPNNLGLNGNVIVHFEPTVTPLKITVQPENKTVAVGDSVTFNVQAEGEWLTYQWYYKRSGENDWSIWNGKTTATATATVDATCDGMQVYCKVTDQNGNSIDSDAAVITVILYFTASPESPQKIGTPITLKATGGSSYRFYYEQDGKWGNIQNDSSENTCVWTPIVPKNYIIYVDIKDENSIIIATKRIEYTVIDAYSFTLDKANVQNVGVNMTLTAKGGSYYKFYYEYNGAWCNITSNTTGVCDWSPKFAGNYMLYVDIRDASGEVVACRTQAFTLKDPFLFICDSQSTEFPYGKTIHLVAAGGSQYKFYYEKQGEWVRVQDFSAASACAWTPTAAGKYNFYCDIKDASGAVASCKRMTFNITNPYSFTADKPITQSVGTEIGFTATGGYQYKFYYEKDGSWVRIQSFSTANTCSWTPTVAGRYNVYCDIADENGTVLAYKGMEFVIGSVNADSYTFKTSIESPKPMNTAVTLTATGGSSYKFYYEVGGKWATIQNFSTTNTATWTPDMIADYTLYVDIKNSSGKVVKTLSKKFSATDPYSFTADMTSPQNIGKSVKLTATGGASYKFYYQYSGAWVKIQDSTSATCNWKPNKAGEYMVYVDIKNASGAVVTCRTMKLVFNDPYRFTTSASSLTQPAGTAVSLSANGGASYKFYYEKDGAWVRIQDYSTTKTCTWTPTEAGKYNVFCDIKNASGSVAVCKRITFTITEKCTITASKTNASVGDTITFTATGGSSYKFYYEKDGAWVRIQSFSTSNTCNWKPTAAGDYVVYVDVNDANGNLIGCKGVRCVVG